MKKITMIARADDGGSSRSANLAMEKVTKAGFIQNISVMAPCAYVEDLYNRVGGNKKICFGMHMTLNAEWDRVKWGPVSALPPNCGLLDAAGYFLPDPAAFAEVSIDVGAVMGEVSAQLDALTKVGFEIRYVDSHMLPERYIPGLDEAMETFINKKGLLDHMYFYNLPPGFQEVAAGKKSLAAMLLSMPPGQYFTVAHPAVASEEMRLTGNSAGSGESVCAARDKEARLYANRFLPLAMALLGIRPIRYDEATPGRRVGPRRLRRCSHETGQVHRASNRPPNLRHPGADPP
jgi:predicted glycoside hydrolase/deacetylase ChbG (UPF0249 family)